MSNERELRITSDAIKQLSSTVSNAFYHQASALNDMARGIKDLSHSNTIPVVDRASDFELAFLEKLAREEDIPPEKLTPEELSLAFYLSKYDLVFVTRDMNATTCVVQSTYITSWAVARIKALRQREEKEKRRTFRNNLICVFIGWFLASLPRIIDWLVAMLNV